MTPDTIYDALESCLQALDQGADLESCLARYPQLADELRPILDAAIQARAAAVTDVPIDVARRGRARVLQAAAEIREQRNAAPVLPFWRRQSFFGARFYRLAATAAVVVIFLLTGGTGLVNASNGALPGDKLYPVKRSWEGVQLAFVFNPQTKSELEHKFEHERVQEIEELYSEKRFEQVNFQGVVETQQTDRWRISGLDVAIEKETVYIGEIAPGAFVQVFGETDDGIIKAGQIILLATPGVTPTVIYPSTAIPMILETQVPEAGDDSAGGESKTIEDAQTPNAPKDLGGESETNPSVVETSRPGKEDSSGSKDGSSSGENSQPATDDSGGGD
jgi:hypothetical protein